MSILILQETAYECAIACLAMIGAYYGYTDKLTEYRKLFDSPLKKQSFNDLCKAAQKIHLTAIGVKDVRLEEPVLLPCIAQLAITDTNFHFVVIYNVDNAITLGDPARGIRIISKNIFNKMFTGNVLLLYQNGDDIKKQCKL